MKRLTRLIRLADVRMSVCVSHVHFLRYAECWALVGALIDKCEQGRSDASSNFSDLSAALDAALSQGVISASNRRLASGARSLLQDAQHLLDSLPDTLQSIDKSVFAAAGGHGGAGELVSALWQQASYLPLLLDARSCIQWSVVFITHHH
jgi:hypothetical protein